jgi:flagellar basal body-associated protein FliL
MRRNICLAKHKRVREHVMAKKSGTQLKKSLISLIIIVTVLVAAVSGSFFFFNQSQSQPVKAEKFYVGVAFCGNTTAEARLLIDRVKSYTNLLVLQSGPVSKNETATNEICDYAVQAGLSIVVYFGDLNPRVLTNETRWRTNWVNTARQRWGERLLGVYYYDEPGGIWLDSDWSQFPRAFTPNSTYDSVATRFIRGFQRDPGTVQLKNNSIPIFVSDYALYWFDYLSGYDVVLAQVGWNRSLPQDIAMLRGAARIQNRDWGAIIGWKYTAPPYLDTGVNIYSQMVDAYTAGAKYIVLFNYPQLDGNAYGVMTDEHFDALERFWNDVVKNPTIVPGSIAAETALVLPKNYGWGMRNPEDHIWGFWGPDDKSTQIWTISCTLLSQYGLHLDIVYDDPNFPLEAQYAKVYYWNQTT